MAQELEQRSGGGKGRCTEVDGERFRVLRPDRNRGRAQKNAGIRGHSEAARGGAEAGKVSDHLHNRGRWRRPRRTDDRVAGCRLSLCQPATPYPSASLLVEGSV